MNRFSTYASTALVTVGMFVSFARAEDMPATPPPDADMEAAMKKVEAAGTPGEAHKALEPLVGEWTAEVKCWMSPGEPPMSSRATAKAAWAMNGRFVQEEFTGEMMGKPFKGMSLTGYDNVKQKYVTVWVDDMSTGIFTSEGEASEGGKVITFNGTMACPATGEKDMPVKQVVRLISADQHVFEMYDPRQGENGKTMEITYARKEKQSDQ